MQARHIVREVTTPESFRVAKVASMFDVPLADKVRREWNVQLDLPADWQIGVIVGPSGSGKSTIACELWPDHYTRGYEWDDRSVLDNFPADATTDAIVQALTSVGFSSPPDWIKPYHALSTGQQMRCDLARALMSDDLVVFDEFTSVVDRTVAQIGSAAIAKAIRRTPGRQFIAVTCHADVLAWLEPDWVYEPHTATFARGCLQRPPLDLVIQRVHSQAWPIFAPYHYLSAALNPSAVCYAAFLNDTPIAFCAVLPLIGFKNVYRASRTVVLPDYQGIGIGTRFSDAIAAMYHAQGKRYRSTSSHPAFMTHRDRSSHWKLVEKKPLGTQPQAKMKRLGMNAAHSALRSVVTFEYVG